MAIEEELSKRMKSLPDIVVALVWAGIFTGAGFLFVFFAKALYTLPGSFDLPWLMIFAVVFFAIIVRKRIKIIRQDTKPALS
ncbi:MAG: hypothetical protein NTY20_05265 [Candidatus Aenigmarchaeota archaeon]|nr:hypothetical protein [Candidatus Aenigmarchaeota archaeon]